jgi:hypothetical protein
MIQPLDGSTLYRQLGHWPGYGAVLWLVAWLALRKRL